MAGMHPDVERMSIVIAPLALAPQAREELVGRSTAGSWREHVFPTTQRDRTAVNHP